MDIDVRVVIIEEIISALSKAGYDPYIQIVSYLESNDLTFITRKDNARNKIARLSQDWVGWYINSNSI
mgnify:CR=1 FL=1